MLAFLGPVQIMFLLLVVLIVFGPQKLPEIGQQLGRALRELRRAGQELQNSINLDNFDDPPRYDPPRYDSYSSNYNNGSNYSSDSDYYGASSSEREGPTPLPKPEPPRGDAAAAALSDANSDFNFGTPEGSVPRSKS